MNSRIYQYNFDVINVKDSQKSQQILVLMYKGLGELSKIFFVKLGTLSQQGGGGPSEDPPCPNLYFENSYQLQGQKKPLNHQIHEEMWLFWHYIYYFMSN